MLKYIQNFINEFEKKYNKKLQILVVKEGKEAYPEACRLKVLEKIVIQAMHKECEHLKCIKSFKKVKTRRREILMWIQVHCNLAVRLGFSKSYIGRSVGKDHATIIHRANVVENLLEIGEKDITKVYNLVIKQIKEYVGIISTNLKGEDDTKSVLSALRNKKESIITIT
jgi:uncharacterized protein YktA (UPF0223 family)